MKICFVIGSLSFSGAEKVLSALIDKLSKKGNKIHVILLQGENKENKEQENLITYGVNTSGSRIKRIIMRKKLINNYINEIKPDFVVSFGYVSNINTSFSLWNNKYKLILCERNDPNYDIRDKFSKIKRKLFYKRADGMVLQTEEIKSYFNYIPNIKKVVIPNPVIEDNTNNEVLFKNTKKIVTIARLDDYQKNQTMLIKSLKKIKEYMPEYKLYIYGNGPDKEKYENLIEKLNLKDSVYLCGKTSDVRDALRDKEIFVLSSNYEGMPNALIEAMQFGMPCISTDCGGGGAKALITNNENGILIKKGSQEDLEKAIITLGGDLELKNKISQNALFINKELCIDEVCNKWIKYFNEICE